LRFFENIVVAPNFAAPIRTNSKKTKQSLCNCLKKKTYDKLYSKYIFSVNFIIREIPMAYHINDGIISNGLILSSGTSMYIHSGGTANNTTVNNLGFMDIYSGGTANNTTVN
jgi:autotransporter passenger strand-loop-strand repeat protein